MIADKFFTFYKNSKWFIKILLFEVLLIFCLFWVIGSLAHWDRLIMFLIGIITGLILMYFFYPYINNWINIIINWFKNIF